MSDNYDQTFSFGQPITVGIEEEMKRSYLDCSISVIIGRACSLSRSKWAVREVLCQR